MFKEYKDIKDLIAKYGEITQVDAPAPDPVGPTYTEAIDVDVITEPASKGHQNIINQYDRKPS